MGSKKAPRATGWVIGTVMLMVALGALAWFFAISPVLDEAALAGDQAQNTRDANDLLEIRIVRLAEQFEELDASKAELAALQQQIPTDRELADYHRQLDEIATTSGVTLAAVTSNEPFVVVPAVTAEQVAAAAAAEAAAAAAADDAPSAQDQAEGASTAAATAPTSALPGFVAMPMTMTVVGSYDNVVGFLEAVQTGTSRLFLVTNWTATGQDASEASGGRPATVEGDVELVLVGQAYVLVDPSAATTPDEPTQAAPLPGAVPGKNPLLTP